MPTSSRTFSRRSSSTTLWIFFSLLESSSHLVDHCDVRQLVRPRLNSATQYFTIVNEEADSPRVESSSEFILVGLRPFKYFTIVNEEADSPRVESSSEFILVGLRSFK
ncbi:hypothetical protein TNCV_3532451 [Trichonephila clavipes]|nr:hypothetical protein TNCV_3532451 [Trichonephila clavipes]